MESIVCDNKQQALDLLQIVKEYTQDEATKGDYEPSVVAFHLSMIDAVEEYINSSIVE